MNQIIWSKKQLEDLQRLEDRTEGQNHAINLLVERIEMLEDNIDNKELKKIKDSIDHLAKIVKTNQNDIKKNLTKKEKK